MLKNCLLSSGLMYSDRLTLEFLGVSYVFLIASEFCSPPQHHLRYLEGLMSQMRKQVYLCDYETKIRYLKILKCFETSICCNVMCTYTYLL